MSRRHVPRRFLKTLFVDTCYWIARANRHDQLHERAVEITQTLTPFRMVTTDYILIEFLNYFAERGAVLRQAALRIVRRIQNDEDILVVPQSRELMAQAMDLYEQRPDKGYSLVDCASFCVMRELGLYQALTDDTHFEQESFLPLLKYPL